MVALVATVGTLTACEPVPPTPVDIYSFAGGCHALRDATTGRVVRLDALGATTVADAARATPFRMQATALGRYLFFGPDGRMLQVAPLGTVTTTKTPGPPADWTITASGAQVSFAALTNGRGLTVDRSGRVAHSTLVEARWELVGATGCAAFPDIDPGMTGTPLRGPSPTARVRGFLDAHTHVSAFRFLGGRFHCGRPWSPYGVTVALEDCLDHQGMGVAAAAENLLATGSPVGTHDPDGWPTFAGWPRPESLTHEGTYWRWIERAWRGGLRIMVNDLVENGALCEIYPLKAGTSCNEMDSVRMQAADMYALQDYIDAQFKGPGKGFFRIVTSSAEARRVINEGKLAVVLGVEVSEVLDCGRTGQTPHCTEQMIDDGLDELHDLGVRSLFPVHKFDNALGGTAYDDGATGLLVNVGNRWATGEWWSPEQCAPGAAEHDNEPTNLNGNQEVLAAVLGEGVRPLLGGDLPAYPMGPLCNPRGLTDLGRHAIEALADRGMIIETDHLSVKARQETLAILERRGYSGLITSHSWGDGTSQERLQDLGGVVAPYAVTSSDYVEDWRRARATRAPGLFGIGYGTDTNGLGAQADVRPGNAANPVRYPFRTFDGGTVVDRHRSGTRVWDINTDGAAHYGLFPDWVEDLRVIAGPQIVEDLANGAEAYLQMWARAERAAR
ncbi:Coagulation factor 5/8 type domain-containing protein [Iamia sp. SCSIO 61187]|nr:Coagulation factor 5/8 type domain-containing protein [Iamia sp. SCSIO 61187]